MSVHGWSGGEGFIRIDDVENKVGMIRLIVGRRCDSLGKFLLRLRERAALKNAHFIIVGLPPFQRVAEDGNAARPHG